MKRWAVGITALYVTFVIAVISMVIFMNMANFDLVDENYYEREIKYQDHIDKVKRTQDEEMALEIKYFDKKLSLIFADNLDYSACKGVILFYYPALKKEDFKVTLNPDQLGKQVIDIPNNVKRGNWIVKIDWTYNGAGYYSEEQIFID